MQNRSSIFIDSLSTLVADKQNNDQHIENFLKQYRLLEDHTLAKPVDVDALSALESLQFLLSKTGLSLEERNSNGLRLIEVAARSGSPASIQYLVETCKVSLKTDENTPNLVERALNNPTVRHYLLDASKQLWRQFQDGTTEFLAHVMAGRMDQAKELLNKDPHLICDTNIRHQNAVHWSHFINDHAAWFKARIEEYLLISTAANHYANAARAHACLAHFKRYQYSHRPIVALEQYAQSVDLYKKAIDSCTHKFEKYQLRTELTSVLLHCGRMHLQMKSNHREAAIASLTLGDACVVDGIKTMQSLPKELQKNHTYLLDCLYREHAANQFMLDDLYDAQATEVRDDPLDAVNFYKKSITYGEEAIRSIGEMTHKTRADHAALIQYCDKLAMSYGAASHCHITLATQFFHQHDATSHHQSEAKKHKTLQQNLLERTTEEYEQPSKLVPLKAPVGGLFTKHAGVAPMNGNHGLLKSPNGNIRFLNLSPKFYGTNSSNGEMPELVLNTSLRV